jgi:FlaA1/EpsC-like NDP-sugar epimerase
MGEPIRIAELASDLIRLSNHTQDEIPVVFTGLRPGEKLFEEIRLDGESVSPTVHPQIVITSAPQPDTDRIRRWMSSAETTSLQTTPTQLLRDLVREYEPFVEKNRHDAAETPAGNVLVGSFVSAR